MDLLFLYHELNEKSKNRLKQAYLADFGFKTHMTFYRALRRPSVPELDYFLQKFGLTFEQAKQKIAQLQKESATENFGLKPVQK